MRKPLLSLLFFLIFFFSGCAALQSGYEIPVVSLSSFEAIPTQSILPQFNIGLHIINPNRSALKLKGLSYTIALEGHKILTGVSNDLPQIEPYGEGDVQIIASVDLFNSIRFFTDLIKTTEKKAMSYTFTAKLDAGSLHPLIRVKQEGTLSFNTLNKNK